MAALFTRRLPQQKPLTKGLGRIRCSSSYTFVLRDFLHGVAWRGSSSQPSCIDSLEVLKENGSIVYTGSAKQNPLTRGLRTIRCSRSYTFVLRDFCLVLHGEALADSPDEQFASILWRFERGDHLHFVWKGEKGPSEQEKQKGVEVLYVSGGMGCSNLPRIVWELSAAEGIDHVV
ncbi:hypothetical protein CDAR_296811 [Caerostris darwini]|uniref:Uncharacterized protein n=1 Tax=Caerostris darwini TaxID=1538125 RepID=A0AAV4NA90_9ARAC|nr:hypothetical protein CDAR_296811 [Caerostris darwini]